MFTVRARRLTLGVAGMPGLLWRHRHAERGAVAVLVALLLPVLLGVAGLVVDVGSWYLTRAQLQNAADAAALAGAQYLPNNPAAAATAAQTLAGKNVSGATVTSVTPYGSSSGEIQVTVTKRGTTSLASVLGIGSPTITATAVASTTQGTGAFIYGSSTACDAINIANSDIVSTTTIWSNGGITATGQPVTVSGQVDIGNSACPFPGTLTPPGPTNVGAYSGWPVALPTTAQGNFPSTCPNSTIIIFGSSWTSSNPPGIYCSTGNIYVFNSGTMSFTGYEFISELNSSTAIDIINSGTMTFTGYCPSACSSGSTPQTVFYATAGGISYSNSATGSITGDMFAPNGQVSMTVSGGTETGFIEASTVSVTNSGSTVATGTGTSSSGGTKLIG